jgi:putative hydrolase of the HAD superfamily
MAIFISFLLLRSVMSLQLRIPGIGMSTIRAVSFDVTGTLLVHKYPIVQTYAEAAKWAGMDNPPTSADLKPAFKQAYREALLERPCFRNENTERSSRAWWYRTVLRAMELTGRTYSKTDFDRFFRRVYQHYGSPEGYEVLSDTVPLLDWLRSEGVSIGIITNTPSRTIETVVPLLGLHDQFKVHRSRAYQNNPQTAHFLFFLI